MITYKINIGVQEEYMAKEVADSLSPLKSFVYVCQNYPSFSKMMNDIITQNKADIFIFCSHRVRPKQSDIFKMLDLINQGYGFVTLYRLACFGCKMELFRRIGFFDERYLRGGWEDNDFYIRLKEADISYIESEEIEYHASPSTWTQPTPRPFASEVFHAAKWSFIGNKIIRNKLNETYDYDIGQSDQTITFKPWSESKLIYFSEFLNEYSF